MCHLYRFPGRDDDDYDDDCAVACLLQLFSYRCKVVPATAFLGLGCELNLIAESGSMRDILDVALSSSHLNLLCLVRGPSGELAVQWSEIDEPHTKPHPSDGAGSIGVIQFRRVGDVARAGFSSYDQRLLDFSPPVNGLLDEDECIESLLVSISLDGTCHRDGFP